MMCVYQTQLEAIQEALNEPHWPDEQIIICLGPPACDGPEDLDAECPYCAIIKGDDTRTAEQILKSIKLGH